MNNKKAIKCKLLSIVVISSIIHPAVAPGKPPEIIKHHFQQEHLSILTWNVYMLPKIATLSKEIGNTKLEKRASEIGNYLSNSKYDVIVFQEVFSRKGYHILKEKLKKNYPFISEPFNDQHIFKTHSGLVLVSKFPIEKFKTIQFSDCSSSDCLSNKGAFVACFTVNNRRFRIVGTHLQADYEYLSEHANVRTKQLKQIINNFNINLEDKSYTNIFCGDFNIAREDSVPYKNLLTSLKSVNYETTCCNYTWQDYHAKEDKKYVYDYCLVNQPHEEDCIEQHIMFNINKDFETKPSDHFPVELIVSLQQEKLLTQNYTR